MGSASTGWCGTVGGVAQWVVHLLGGVAQWVVHLLGGVVQWVVHLLGGVAQWVARLIHKWSVLNSSQIKNLLFPCARNFTLIA